MSSAAADLRIVSPHLVLGASAYKPEVPPLSTTIFPKTGLVADLRLDNHADLVRALDLNISATDDQVLAEAWGRWGVSLVDHLLGGFAFACWDAERRTLFLARDHAGERPLHFSRNADGRGGFAFASMPLALCGLPGVSRCIDPRRMADFLTVLSVQGTESFFEGVERLPPGCWLRVSADGIEMRRYWRPAEARQIRYRRDEDYVEDFRERFDLAVSARLEGSHGIASELSAGLDSGSVTVTAARLLAAQGRKLTSFTAVPLPGYGGEALRGRFGDEGPLAAETAAGYPNIEHLRVTVAEQDLVAVPRRYSEITGQPVFNALNELWMDAVLNQMHSRGLDVLLQGACGNATISYDGLMAFAELFRRGRWISLFRRARGVRAAGFTSWHGAAEWAMGGISQTLLQRANKRAAKEAFLSRSPIHPNRVAEYRLFERYLSMVAETEKSPKSMRRHLYEYYDPGVFNGAAAASRQLALRDPTQDKRIFEFCFGIPLEQYLVGDQTRSLVRRAMRGRMPESALRRTTRGLQAADWYLVVGGALKKLDRELTRIEGSPLACWMIDTARLRRLLQTWPSGRYGDQHVFQQWNLVLTRGIAAGGFLADHDPDASRE